MALETITPAERLELLIRGGKALYGPKWQSPLARGLGIDLRSIQRWVAGDRSIARRAAPAGRALPRAHRGNRKRRATKSPKGFLLPSTQPPKEAPATGRKSAHDGDDLRAGDDLSVR
jgi:hypothetical protein